MNKCGLLYLKNPPCLHYTIPPFPLTMDILWMAPNIIIVKSYLKC